MDDQEKTLNEVKQLVRNYLKKEAALVSDRIYYELPALRTFIKNFIQVNKVSLKLIEDQAPNFNLFKIISINHLEAKVHTPILANLLDVNGTHMQGRLFFDAFMYHLFKNTFNPEAVKDVSVIIERSDYENGRMDVVILYTENGLHKEIVIENKIYHHDENQQLTRYYWYLTRTRNLKKGNYHLVYLTPEGKTPSVLSITKELYTSLKADEALTELGYVEDISSILDTVLPQIKAPVVTQTIIQYIQTIKKL